MGQGEDAKLKKSGGSYPALKRNRGNENETPPAGSDGHLIGSSGASKGYNHKEVIKHDGIVIGGSVTAGRPSTSAKSINKLPKNKRNIVGSG